MGLGPVLCSFIVGAQVLPRVSAVLILHAPSRAIGFGVDAGLLGPLLFSNGFCDALARLDLDRLGFDAGSVARGERRCFLGDHCAPELANVDWALREEGREERKREKGAGVGRKAQVEIETEGGRERTDVKASGMHAFIERLAQSNRRTRRLPCGLAYLLEAVSRKK